MSKPIATPNRSGVLEVPGRGYYVYRHIGPRGEVLYVGMTNNVLRRSGQHYAAKWWPQVMVIEWDQYDTDHQARHAESVMIRTLMPPHNVAGTSTYYAVPDPYVFDPDPPERTHEEAVAAARDLALGERY